MLRKAGAPVDDRTGREHFEAGELSSGRRAPVLLPVGNARPTRPQATERVSMAARIPFMRLSTISTSSGPASDQRK